MTKKQAKALKPGDRVVNRDGVEYKVIRVNGGWNGFLTSQQIAQKKGYDWYAITVRESPFLQYDHKDLWLAE